MREACLLRFRPILMTTLAAALGALPLAIGFGEGSELRQPLGVAIIGGLIASQLLTLLTTPVVYILLDKLRRRARRRAPSEPRAASPRQPDRHEVSRACVEPLDCRGRSAGGPGRVGGRGLHRGPGVRAAGRADAARVTRRRAATGWVPAAPADALDRGAWWTLFGDAELNRAGAAGRGVEPERRRRRRRLRAGTALVREQRAALFPSRRARRGGVEPRPERAVAGPNGQRVANSFQVGLGASWEPDVWGRLAPAR